MGLELLVARERLEKDASLLDRGLLHEPARHEPGAVEHLPDLRAGGAQLVPRERVEESGEDGRIEPGAEGLVLLGALGEPDERARAGAGRLRELLEGALARFGVDLGETPVDRLDRVSPRSTP